MLSVLVYLVGTQPAKEAPNVQTYNNLAVLLPWVRAWDSLRTDEVNQELFYFKLLDQQKQQQSAIANTRVSKPTIAPTYTYTVESWRSMVSQYNWPVDDMLRIMSCESGGRPNAVGGPDYDGLYDYGLFQIHGDPTALDPVYNVQIAYAKYESGGFKPWLGSASCHHLY